MLSIKRNKNRHPQAKFEEPGISTIAGTVNAYTEKPRVVHLRKGEDGYGFFLHTSQNSPMHCITEIEKDSAAEKAGLRNEEVVACVNGQDAMHVSHQQCVTMIRDSGDSVVLTVASKQAMDVFYHYNLAVKPELPHNWKYLNDFTFYYTNPAFEDALQTNETPLCGLEKGSSYVVRENREENDPFQSNIQVSIQQLPTSKE